MFKTLLIYYCRNLVIDGKTPCRTPGTSWSRGNSLENILAAKFHGAEDAWGYSQQEASDLRSLHVILLSESFIHWYRPSQRMPVCLDNWVLTRSEFKCAFEDASCYAETLTVVLLIVRIFHKIAIIWLLLPRKNLTKDTCKLCGWLFFLYCADFHGFSKCNFCNFCRNRLKRKISITANIITTKPVAENEILALF